MSVTVIKIGVNQPTVISNLSHAWRQLLANKNITETELEKRTLLFVQLPGEHLGSNQNAATNIRKELASDDMSWKVFVKGLTILGVDDITLLV